MNIIQQKILKVYKCFKNICDKYHLRYFAIGGTCIGAIRHHGFIPWDDDLDVAMPLTDYIYFFQVAEKELLGSPYNVIGPKTSRHYSGIYNKLQDKSTTDIENEVKQFPDRYTGVFIDIFPITGSPQGEQERNTFIRLITNYQRINLRLRFPYYQYQTLKWRLPWLAVQPIKLFKSYDFYTDKQFELLKQYRYGESAYICFPWRIRQRAFFHFEDFQKPMSVEFENTTISVPNGYDQYLKKDFGDYMKLPPKDRRIGGHPAFVDLNRPFSYYANLMRQGKLDFSKLEGKN